MIDSSSPSVWKLIQAPALHAARARKLVEAINEDDEDRAVQLMRQKFPWKLHVDHLMLAPAGYIEAHRPHRQLLSEVLVEKNWPRALEAFTQSSKVDISVVLCATVNKGKASLVQVLLKNGAHPNGLQPWERPGLWVKNPHVRQELSRQAFNVLTQDPRFDPWAPTQTGASLLGLIHTPSDPANGRKLSPIVPLPLACLQENAESTVCWLLEFARQQGLPAPAGALESMLAHVQDQLMDAVNDFSVYSLNSYFHYYRETWASLAQSGAPCPTADWVQGVVRSWGSVSGRADLDESGLMELMVEWAHHWGDPQLTAVVLTVGREAESSHPAFKALQAQDEQAQLKMTTPQAPSRAHRRI